MLLKTKSQNECFFPVYFPAPPPKKNPKWWLYSCGELVWNDPMGLLILLTKGQFHTRSDISKKMKTEHICQTIDSSITIVVSN